VLPVKDVEGGEAHVEHFLLAKNEALIGRSRVRFRYTRSWRCGRGRSTHQRKTQSGGTQRLHGGGIRRALLPRSLLDPCHGRILRKFLRKRSTRMRSAKPPRKDYLCKFHSSQGPKSRHNRLLHLRARAVPGTCVSGIGLSRLVVWCSSMSDVRGRPEVDGARPNRRD
jgi:hypothetical protein